jgi:hypothetical protein
LMIKGAVVPALLLQIKVVTKDPEV